MNFNNKRQPNKLDDIGSGVHKLYDLINPYLPKEKEKRDDIIEEFFKLYTNIIITAEFQNNDFALQETQRHCEETVEEEEKFLRSSSRISSSSSPSSKNMNVNQELDVVLRLSEETARREEVNRNKELMAKSPRSQVLELSRASNNLDNQNTSTVFSAGYKFAHSLGDRRNYNNSVNSVASTSYSQLHQ